MLLLLMQLLPRLLNHILPCLLLP